MLIASTCWCGCIRRANSFFIGAGSVVVGCACVVGVAAVPAAVTGVAGDAPLAALDGESVTLAAGAAVVLLLALATEGSDGLLGGAAGAAFGRSVTPARSCSRESLLIGTPLTVTGPAHASPPVIDTAAGAVGGGTGAMRRTVPGTVRRADGPLSLLWWDDAVAVVPPAAGGDVPPLFTR